MKKLKILKKLEVKRLSEFIINKKNIHLFDKVGNVYLRKNRLSTVVHVDVYGNIIKIEGENEKKLKLGDNIYNI